MAVLFHLSLALLVMANVVVADVYMHSPRGSNNRLKEASANRNNGNRLFDSQNNNRGGYNAGDKATGKFNAEADIYYEKFFMSGANPEEGPMGRQSLLTVEWSNQHGCGGNEDSDPHKMNCQVVMQYMCQPRDETFSEAGPLEMGKQEIIRNGQNTNTQNYNAPNNVDLTTVQRMATASNQVQASHGLHEQYRHYDECYVRERNSGLFTADQNLRNTPLGYSSAIYTRQNPNGNRRGYECPEERDHYPYWHPTPWRDVAVFANHPDHCEYYQRESANVVPRYFCKETDKWFSRYNNDADCTANGGTWTPQYNYLEVDTTRTTRGQCEAASNDGYTRVWDKPLYEEANACLVLLPPPECLPAQWSRVNHHGNGRHGAMLNYTWTIPYFPSQDTQRCVFRLRYNISTDDYDPWNTNSSQNQNRNSGVYSPVTNNPNIDIGSTTNKPLRLAVNTNQFGRTFQDRSHVFILRPRNLRGNAIPNADRERRIYNLNVRGKRGNIVQTYPSVEYDFVPNRLDLGTEDLIHFQWTGSNTHNNGNPAGDGQAGDAGEGTSGTDRTNVVETMNETVNYPVPWEKASMFKNAEVVWTSGVANPSAADVAVFFASSGYYQCVATAKCAEESAESKTNQLNVLLNNAPASFEGAVLRFPAPANYYYICSRNNNFTNRSQKGRLCVK